MMFLHVRAKNIRIHEALATIVMRVHCAYTASWGLDCGRLQIPELEGFGFRVSGLRLRVSELGV